MPVSKTRSAINKYYPSSRAITTARGRATERAQTYNRSRSRIAPRRNSRGPSPEIKSVDLMIGTATTGIIYLVPSASAPAPILLNGLQTGTSIYQRIGNKVEMKSLRIRGHLTPIASGYTDWVRIVVVYDKQTSGSAPTYAQVFNNMNQAGNSLAGDFDFPNTFYSDRFTILRDQVIPIPAYTYSSGTLTDVGPTEAGTNFAFEMFIPLNKAPVQYKSTSNPVTSADISTGAVYLFALSLVNTNAMKLDAAARLRYYDA